ncbi:MAG: hypothetical protein ACI88H_000917 [Cocleimonas sp.]|jgi:hypothetical protein
MFKTFSLTKKQEEQISATEGKMTFHLRDETGIDRTVWGLTQLDEDLNAISIVAPRAREHPLIQCLFLTNVNEKINIEFTQYNDVFERKTDKVEITSAEDIERIAKEMQNKPMRVGALLKSTEIKTTESIN